VALGFGVKDDATIRRFAGFADALEAGHGLEWDSLKRGKSFTQPSPEQCPAVSRRFPRMYHPQRPSSLKSLKRSGLTLMELVVVMVILMALAAIVLPMLPSMIERAHRASQGTNDIEITKAMQLYQSMNGYYPDGFDLLTDGIGQLVDYLPAASQPGPVVFPGDTLNTTGTNYLGFTAPVGGYVSAGQLTAGGLAALNGAGIINEYAMMATAQSNGYANWTPTFNPYQSDLSNSGLTSLAVGTYVCYVAPSGVLYANLVSPSVCSGSSSQFILLGLGKRCSAVGTSLTNPGYNFPNDAVHENPDLVYERFCLVFQLEDINKKPLAAAQFLGTVAIESNVMLSVDKVNESYTENVIQQNGPQGGPGI
jgi:type II secretory pathway pseudopilin PulG